MRPRLDRRLHAYVLAADPTWVASSIRAYYDHVDAIVVSYDVAGLGWTGHPIPVEESLRLLRVADPDSKMRFIGGSWHDERNTPMANDTAQRRHALAEAGRGADWVLQIDTDEVLPNVGRLLEAIDIAIDEGLPAVEWPMRVLYRRLSSGRFAEVCSANGSDRFDYPGPIAVRPTVNLIDARRTDGPFLRPVVYTDGGSLQVRAPMGAAETRRELLTLQDAILHNSWARDFPTVTRKVASWGHSEGWRSWDYLVRRWLPSPLIWRWQRDLHPFASGLWPRLRRVDLAGEVEG